MNLLPSKKQHALLMYIDGFIKENNYAPSYREVMRALDYKSVSTVATHINGLIERGWLVKRDNSARSVEVLYKEGQTAASEKSPAPSLPVSSEAKRHLSEDELIEMLTAARQHVEVGARYTHFKGGSYTVVDLAIQTTDDTACVVYRAEYGDKLLFTRPLSEWLEQVEVDGRSVDRFREA